MSWAEDNGIDTYDPEHDSSHFKHFTSYAPNPRTWLTEEGVALPIIDDIFDEYEEIIKSERKKARSIVAMLFWKMKRQKKVFQKYYEAYGHNNSLTNCYRGMFEQALMDFNKSRKMLKDNT